MEPTIAAPALSVVSSPPKVDIVPPPESKGAKLKIQRVPAAAMPEEDCMAAEPENLQFARRVQETQPASRHSRQPSQSSGLSSFAAPQARPRKFP